MKILRKDTSNSFFTVLAMMFWLSATTFAQAVEGTASLDIRHENGFARIVFSFDRLPDYSSQTISTVFVLKFKNTVAVDLGAVATKLPNIVTIARRDPDGYGLRFAMTQDYKVNVMRAGNHLVVDFLAKGWRGRLPGIPQDIIDKLAKEAEAARLAAAERARQEAMQINPLRVDVHHAGHPTFNRIQFSWNRFVTSQLTRKGDEVIVLFGGRATPDLTQLRVHPPKNLKRIHHELGKDSLRIVMLVSKGTKVRAFREGRDYVVDLTIAEPGKLSTIEEELFAATQQGERNKRSSKREEVTLPANDEQTITPLQVKKLQSSQQAERVKDSRTSPPMPQRPIGKKTASSPPADEQPAKLSGTVQHHGNAKSAEPAPFPPLAKAGAKKQDVVIKPVARGALIPLTEQVVEGKKSPKALDNKIAITRNENSVQLRFPFRKDKVAAAIFQRHETLWILIDSPQKIELKGLKEQLGGIVNSIRYSQLDKSSQLFEFKLSGPWLSSVSQRGFDWNISIGDLVTGTSKKYKPQKRLNNRGVAEVFIPTDTRGRLHQIKDLNSGDELVVITSPGPALNVKKKHAHVEFELFKTIHGIVVRPLSDDLNVTKNQHGVKIASGKSLSLSRAVEKAPTKKQKPNNKRRMQARKLEFKNDQSKDIEKFIQRTLQLEKIIADLNGRKQKKARLQLAQHLLSRGFAPEAFGMLEVVASENEDVIREPVFRLMRGIANVMLGRYKKAHQDLDTNDLVDNPHAFLWKGIAAYRKKKFSKALAQIKKGTPAIKSYLPRHQAMFHLAAADSAIENKEPVIAASELDNLPKQGILPLQAAMSRLLEGRLMEMQNKSRVAMQLYADATKDNIRPITARAVFHLTDLRLRLGDIKPALGVKILERLSVVWRGDDVELQVLHRLADLYLEEGRYNDAFNLMETAVRAYPKSEKALALQDRMKASFEELFLQGKADKKPPIKALALFYDHKRLTPPGRLGDEMIRRLADRLINVDLLDKAADLLEHQVSRRLKGAGRAQVAIRLAMIHLLQQRPKLALSSLYRTRQPKLPVQVREARKLLEARAYAELGRSGPALELLANDVSSEAGEIKALALWNGKKWTKAGEQYEKNLGGQWRSTKALTTKQRLQVLRAAISYTLGDDRLGVDRLREKFATKMARGEDAEAFALITDPLKTSAGAIDRLARDIADIDTLEAFIKAFRQRLEHTGGSQTASAAQ